MIRGILTVLLISIASLEIGEIATVFADDWPEYRGPTGDGHALSANLPEAIDSSSVLWEISIHGKGWSSPVIWGDQIWLTTATEEGKQMSVIGVQRTSGRILCDQVLIENEEPAYSHPANSYASCTPAIEEGRVYLHYGSYLTACLDTHTLEVLWRREDIQCDHYRGPGSSPILHNDMLFVAYDGFDKQFVVALDKQTGKTVWRTDREIDYGTDNGDWAKAYATGEVISVGGQDQLVVPSASATIAYDPKSGKVQWTVYHGGMNASARPVFANGLIYLTNGMGELFAVEPTTEDDMTNPPIAWSSKKAVAKKASPIIIDGSLYMNSDDGILSARSAKTGKVFWRHRAGKSYAASPIYAGGLIYFFSVEGDVITVRPPASDSDDQPSIVSHTQLGDGFMASPAVVGNQLVLRSKTKLYSLGKSD